MSAPSLHIESTDSVIVVWWISQPYCLPLQYSSYNSYSRFFFQQHSHVPLIVMINSTVKTISVRHAVTISGRIPMNTLLLLM